MPRVPTLFLIQIVITAAASTLYTCSSNATCGCSMNSAILTKIVGGEQAEIDTWSWAVSIRIYHSHLCGGSLISSTLVLTAAHCLISLQSVSGLSISVGSRYLSIARQVRPVSEVYIPDNYDSDEYINDIAVLRLSSPVDLTDRSVALICLPSSTKREYPPQGASVVAIGWGTLSSGAKKPSNTLQQVELKAMTSKVAICQEMIHDAAVQFCAGVKNGGKGMNYS
jgi:secreted trypsin-like serine protease